MVTLLDELLILFAVDESTQSMLYAVRMETVASRQTNERTGCT
jgi:hypothetical protein